MVPGALSKRIYGVVGLMLIYGNTPKDIIHKIQRGLNRKAVMKKLILAVIVLSIGYFTVAKAEEQTVTPQEFIGSVASVPGKVGEHLQNEWADIKAYQAKSWADAKEQWSNLLSKFQSE